MSTRLIGTDSANPRLPDVVVAATQGPTHSDLAPGDIGATTLSAANAYTDDAIADVVAGGINFADNTETIVGTRTDKAINPAGLAFERPYVDVRTFGAVGDGSTNDIAAIQAAIDAAAGARPVYLPPGVFVIAGNYLRAKGRLVGAGRDATTIRQTSTNQGGLWFDTTSNWAVSDMTVQGTGTPRTNHRLIHAYGEASGGSVHRVRLIGGGLYLDGGGASFDPGSATTNGKQRRVVLDSVWVDSSSEYGISLESTQGCDIVAAQITAATIDGIKLQHTCDDVTVTGGFATGCGQEGLDAFMGGMNLTVVGFKAYANTGNGVTLKTDDNPYGGVPTNYQMNGQTTLIGLICRANSYGLTIDRAGSVDKPAVPLMRHVSVYGGIFEGNTNAGIKVRARNVSLVSVQCRRNGTQGIQVMPETLDCDIISPLVQFNSQTTANTSDGIVVAGTRTKLIGGQSIGKDADTITNDAGYTGLTAQQRYGAVIQGGSTDCEIHNCTAFGNGTGDVATFGTRGLLRSRSRLDLLDAPGTTIRTLTVDAAGKLLIGSTVVGTQT